MSRDYGREARAAKKAAGICYKCNEPTYRGGRCVMHYALALADNRERDRRRRAAGVRGPHRDRPRKGRRVMAGAPALSLTGWHVYTLHDPDTGAVRYVGLSEHPRRRWYLHAIAARQALGGKREPAPVAAWVAGLIEVGKRPVMEIVQPVADEETGLVVERETIQRLLSEGAALLNVQGRRAKRAPKCKRCGKTGHTVRACRRKRLTVAEFCKARRKRLRAAKVCIWCGLNATNGHTRCDYCIARDRARQEARRAQDGASPAAAKRGRPVGRPGRCTVCGEVAGHNRRGCPKAQEAA
jgi:hypothetical protein